LKLKKVEVGLPVCRPARQSRHTEACHYTTFPYPVQITVAVALRLTLPLLAVNTQETVVPPAFAPLQFPVGGVNTA